MRNHFVTHSEPQPWYDDREMLEALSKYRILEKIGEGGMGEVYKAEDPDLRRIVAIKVISAKQSTDSNQEARFLREARAAANFNHPNIASIFDLGKADGKLFIVMEYVDGSNLRRLLKNGPLKMDQLLHLAHQICLALEEAHSHGVLHRDIKPENILIGPGNRVKLVDFGLAYWMQAESTETARETRDRITDSGAMVGTPFYMSPEQLRGMELDARSDIFSFGIVLYEMATAKLPFSGTTPMEIVASILKDPVTPPPTPDPRMLPDFVEVLNRCLEKDRTRRFESARDLQRAMDELQHELRAEHDMITRESFHSRQIVPPPTPTLLVLPFETMGSRDDTSIATGVAHAILTDLARIPGLSVLSRAAAEGEPTRKNPRELARQLRATLLLEGEVLRSGSTLAVMARLIDVDSGHVLWGSRYRGEEKDIFNILDSVCQNISDALPIQVSQQVRLQISRPATRNVSAFELYSRGRALLDRFDVRENVDSAIRLFEEAIGMDSGFALAHAALGEACWRQYKNTHDSSWVRRSISSCDHALVLDPGQARVHVSLAITYFGTGKIDEAIEELDRALTLQPENDDACEWLGRCYEQKGDRDRALAAYQRATALRPVAGHFLQLGACYVAFGLYDRAIDSFRKVISLQPDSHAGYNNLGSLYYLTGQYQDAVDILKQAIQIHPNPESYSNLGSTYFILGRFEEAASTFRTAITLEPANDVYHRNLGDAALKLGDSGTAMAEYRTACDLLRRELGVNPNDGGTHGRLALCLAKSGEKDEALAEIGKARALRPGESLTQYLSAAVFALIGNTQDAIAALRSALALGHSPHEARQDIDLSSLHGLPEFETLFS